MDIISVQYEKTGRVLQVFDRSLGRCEYRNARLGLLLCPTTSFAVLLCELGRQRARENLVGERLPVYSGMMSYEKAVRELPYLG